jgi:hypothetical protein
VWKIGIAATATIITTSRGRFNWNNRDNIGIDLNTVVTTLFGLATGRRERRAWKNRRFPARGRATPAASPQTWASGVHVNPDPDILLEPSDTILVIAPMPALLTLESLNQTQESPRSGIFESQVASHVPAGGLKDGDANGPPHS